MNKCKIQNKELLFDVYVNHKMSTTEISKNSMIIFGFSVSTASVYNTLIAYKIPVRNKSRSISIATSTLDIEHSFLNEKSTEWIDGFLLGDGSIERNHETFLSARFSFSSSELEWTEFAISGLKDYDPSYPKQYEQSKNEKKFFTWQSRTKMHPDISLQAKRWYPNGNKIVPSDVRITPTSLLLWYLGDGSFTNSVRNSSNLRLATCAFEISDIENILIPKMKQIGINCIRDNSKNDIIISSDSVKTFFNIIGHKSPISCYDHKFDVPEWLFYKTLKQIVPDKKDRWKLIKHIQNGKIEYQKSPGGHYLLFNQEQEGKLLEYLHNLSNRI